MNLKKEISLLRLRKKKWTYPFSSHTDNGHHFTRYRTKNTENSKCTQTTILSERKKYILRDDEVLNNFGFWGRVAWYHVPSVYLTLAIEFNKWLNLLNPKKLVTCLWASASYIAVDEYNNSRVRQWGDCLSSWLFVHKTCVLDAQWFHLQNDNQVPFLQCETRIDGGL